MYGNTAMHLLGVRNQARQKTGPGAVKICITAEGVHEGYESPVVLQ